MKTKQRLKTDEAAVYLGIAKATLRKLRHLKQGPAYIKLGRSVVYDTEDLDSWLADNRQSVGDGGHNA